jgi:hypothetical protein
MIKNPFNQLYLIKIYTNLKLSNGLLWNIIIFLNESSNHAFAHIIYYTIFMDLNNEQSNLGFLFHLHCQMSFLFKFFFFFIKPSPFPYLSTFYVLLPPQNPSLIPHIHYTPHKIINCMDIKLVVIIIKFNLLANSSN